MRLTSLLPAIGLISLFPAFAALAEAPQHSVQPAAHTPAAIQGDAEGEASGGPDHATGQQDKAPPEKPDKALDESGLLPIRPKDFNPMMPPPSESMDIDNRMTFPPMSEFASPQVPYIAQLTLLSRWLVWAVVVIALALLLYLRRNAIEAKRLADAANMQCDLAKEQIRLLRESSQRELRAYVYTNGAKGELLSDKSGRYIVRVEVRNFGRTPAYALSGWMTVFVGDVANEKDINLLPHDTEIVQTLLPPGGVCFYYARTPSSITQEVKAIANGVRGIYAYGEIRYKDVSGVERYARFRIKCAGERNLSSGSFDHCASGNEAD